VAQALLAKIGDHVHLLGDQGQQGAPAAATLPG
jgi:hypothetical protein